MENVERKLGIFTESASGLNDPDNVSMRNRVRCVLYSSFASDRERIQRTKTQIVRFRTLANDHKAKHRRATNQAMSRGKDHVFTETSVTIYPTFYEVDILLVLVYHPF